MTVVVDDGSFAAVRFVSPLALFVIALAVCMYQFSVLAVCVARYHARPSPPEFSERDLLSRKPSVSIQGCGYLYAFATGALQYLMEQFEVEDGLFIAVSGGVFPVAALVLGEPPVEWLRRDWPTCYRYYASRATGAILQGPSFLRGLFDSYLPKDAHVPATAMLRPVVTRLSLSRLRAEPVVLSEFSSRKGLLDAMLGALAIPFVTLVTTAWALVAGERCVDGAFCVSAAKLNEQTVLITPFRSHLRPKNFGMVIGRDGFSEQSERRLWSRLKMLAEWRFVFIPTDTKTCLALAEEGYESARARHEMLVDAGWKPRRVPQPSAFGKT